MDTNLVFPPVPCIFCKLPGESSLSVEHILPQSLGNTRHTLPKGVVCDGCNNYFARKLERPVLESQMMRLLRRERRIPNKRNRLPPLEPFVSPELPDYRLMSRLLAKSGLETLAFKTLSVVRSNGEIVAAGELDELRSYAQYNRGADWPFACRTLYPVNSVFREGSTYYELLHEFDILITKAMEYYYVVVIFGVEFAINLGGPMIDGYQRWLEQNGDASPLYLSAHPDYPIFSKVDLPNNPPSDNDGTSSK